MPMDATAPPADFYTGLPIFRDFTEVMDPKLFTPLPGDWMVGVADVVQSTKAIAENRYKAVNMAGAAVIVAVTNAMAGRDFPSCSAATARASRCRRTQGHARARRWPRPRPGSGRTST
jgi:Protein of unknown function (DUF3095)